MTNLQWDILHKDFNLERPLDQDIKKFCKRFFQGDKTEKKVIDVGCGQGHDIYFLSDLKWKCYGVDISKQALCMANYKCLNKKNVYLKQVKPDFINYPYENFDVVFLNNVLSYSDVNILNESKRILKNRGKIFMKVYSDNICNVDNNEIIRKDVVKMFHEEEIYKNMEKSGFKKLDLYRTKDDKLNIEFIVYVGGKI